MVCLGTRTHAQRWPVAGTWLCCSGRVPMAALGTRARAQVQLWAVTWRCCSGRVPMAALGTRARAQVQLRAVTWRCCSGRTPLAVHGMSTRAHLQLRAVTWLCCSGRVRKAARGALDVERPLQLNVRVTTDDVEPHAALRQDCQPSSLFDRSSRLTPRPRGAGLHNYARTSNVALSLKSARLTHRLGARCWTRLKTGVRAARRPRGCPTPS
jgi:hypothetical protein